MAQMDMARQAVLVRSLFEAEIKANPITDAELKAQYEEFKKQMGENEYKVRHILVDKEDDAKLIIVELNKGGDFAKLAKDKSKDPGSKDNGGDLDWGPSARFVKPFADATMALKKGQTVSAPVKTDFGYHVIRLDDVRPLKVPAYDELKDNFRQRAQQQQVAKMVQRSPDREDRGALAAKGVDRGGGGKRRNRRWTPMNADRASSQEKGWPEGCPFFYQCAVASMVRAPAASRVQSRAEFPSTSGAPQMVNGAVSKSGRKARKEKRFTCTPGTFRRSRSTSSVAVSGPCTTSPG